MLCRVSHIKKNETNVRVDDYVVLKVSAIDSASAFDEADLYTTLLANGALALPIIVATKKKSGNKDTKTFLGELAETVSEADGEDPTIVTIASFHHSVHQSPATSHFSDLNLLGSDFTMATEMVQIPDRLCKIVKLHFGGLFKGG